MNINSDSWTIQCEVVQRHELGNEPPEEDPLPNELELGEFVPFDFFGLGQPVAQHEGQGHEQQQQNNDQMGQDEQNVEQQQLGLGLGLNANQVGQQEEGQQQEGQSHQDNQIEQANPWEPQQVNPWEPWPAWPAAQNGLDLNHAPPAHQEIQLDLNEPADPMEVIINPVNPNHNGDFLEINDVLEEIEEHIPQA